MLSEAGLRAEGVSYAYGKRQALHDASLRVNRGCSVALLGPNGSGKTTLLHLLAGSRRPADGGVWLDRQELRELSPGKRARRIAVVSQRNEMVPLFTVAQLVSFGRTPHVGRVPARDNRLAVERALDATGLLTMSRRRVCDLSGGEQQRAFLALALAQETEYLLLDEPTVHLDLHHQHELLELLRNLQKERRLGVLAVLHDLNLASLYFERMVLMSEGRTVAEGEPWDVARDVDLETIFRTPLEIVQHPGAGVPQILLQRDDPLVEDNRRRAHQSDIIAQSRRKDPDGGAGDGKSALGHNTLNGPK